MNKSIPEITASTDTIIIGAGPIGLELAVVFKRLGWDYLHIEARQIGYTFSWWPRETYFFSTTERIEIAGIPAPSTNQQRLTGEQYLAYLRSIVEQFDLKIQAYEPVTKISVHDSDFIIQTETQTGERRYHAKNVILATGDMHAPNLLNIPGENLPHVSHYFRDVHPYFRQRLLVVGGRNSAVETALRCWRAGSQVTLSYRRSKFDSKVVKHWLLPDLQNQIKNGTIQFLPNTQPVEITPEHVKLEVLDQDLHPTGDMILQPADFVLLHTGFVADMSLFEMIGVELFGPERKPKHDPDTMETNVPGLYVAGTAAAGSQRRYTLFIENCHIHTAKIAAAITGLKPNHISSIPQRRYDLPLEAIQDN